MEEVITHRRLYRSKRFLLGRRKNTSFVRRGSISAFPGTGSSCYQTGRTPMPLAIAAFSSGSRKDHPIWAIQRTIAIKKVRLVDGR